MKKFLTGAAIATALILSPATALASPPEDKVCPAFDTGHLSANDQTTYDISAPEGRVIVEVCVKAGSAKQGNGPVVTAYDNVTSLTISHPSGKEISHYSVRYADEPVVIPDPPAEEVEVRVLPDVLNCGDRTVTTTTEGRKTGAPTYDEQTNTWTQGAWGDWEVIDSRVREATQEECPVGPTPTPTPTPDPEPTVTPEPEPTIGTPEFPEEVTPATERKTLAATGVEDEWPLVVAGLFGAALIGGGLLILKKRRDNEVRGA